MVNRKYAVCLILTGIALIEWENLQNIWHIFENEFTFKVLNRSAVKIPVTYLANKKGYLLACFLNFFNYLFVYILHMAIKIYFRIFLELFFLWYSTSKCIFFFCWVSFRMHYQNAFCWADYLFFFQKTFLSYILPDYYVA